MLLFGITLVALGFLLGGYALEEIAHNRPRRSIDNNTQEEVKSNSLN